MSVRNVLVAAIRDHGDVREIDFRSADSRDLTTYPAGSHLGVHISDGVTNAYSLTGGGDDATVWSIAVLRKPDGRGGSQWLHERVVGDSLRVDAPRSAFPVVSRARHHVLIAGGIGVTAILSHARRHARWGASYQVLYVHSPGRAALRQELHDAGHGLVETFEGRQGFNSRLQEVVQSVPFGSDIYTCGPEGLIEAVREAALHAEWPAARIHSEIFEPARVSGDPFCVELTASGRQLSVGRDESLLEALDRAGISVPRLCRRGVCGECRTPVTRGEIDHRDMYLSSEERAQGKLIMPCVSRAANQHLELPL